MEQKYLFSFWKKIDKMYKNSLKHLKIVSKSVSILVP